MGTTAAGLPYPEQTDSVDVVRDIKALADALDLKVFRAWTAYSPLIQDLTIGNGTVQARYQKIGKTVHYTGTITLGTTTVMGATPPQISLPWAAVASLPLGSAWVMDLSDGGKVFPCTATIYSSVSYFLLRAVNGLAVAVANPFAWASGDVMGWALTYETSAAA